MELRYKINAPCAESIRKQLKDNLERKLVELNKEWPGLCKEDDCISTAIGILCVPPKGQRIKRQAFNDALATIYLGDIA